MKKDSFRKQKDAKANQARKGGREGGRERDKTLCTCNLTLMWDVKGETKQREQKKRQAIQPFS